MISAWYPNSLHPAEGDFVKHQVQMMHSVGMDISVFHANLSVRYIFKGMFSQKRTVGTDHIQETIIEQPFWPRNSASGVRRWAKAYQKKIIQHCEENGWPDVIWSHTYLGAYVASLLGSVYDIPIVATIHESQIVAERVPSYHIPFLKQGITSVDEVVAVGKSLRSKLVNYADRDISVIPNFIDFNLFRPSEQKSGSFTFIYVGECIHRKKIDLLIDTFNEFYSEDSQSQLVLVGDGPLLETLKEKANRTEAASAIHFKGRLNQEGVAEELRKSHCLILPSEAETFGIVLAEAMASDLPFISTKNGAPQNILSHPACQFVETEELLVAMRKCLENYSEIDAQSIRAYAEERFSAPVIVNRYLQLFNKVAHKA